MPKSIIKKSQLAPCTHPGPYHLTDDGLAIVKPHPQAGTCFARSQGYVVARIEPSYEALGPELVKALNTISSTG